LISSGHVALSGIEEPQAEGLFGFSVAAKGERKSFVVKRPLIGKSLSIVL
jgi:hypothetical protein